MFSGYNADLSKIEHQTGIFYRLFEGKGGNNSVRFMTAPEYAIAQASLAFETLLSEEHLQITVSSKNKEIIKVTHDDGQATFGHIDVPNRIAITLSSLLNGALHDYDDPYFDSPIGEREHYALTHIKNGSYDCKDEVLTIECEDYSVNFVVKNHNLVVV